VARLHRLFFLQARIVDGDAVGHARQICGHTCLSLSFCFWLSSKRVLKVQTLHICVQSFLAFVGTIERGEDVPLRQGRLGVCVCPSGSCGGTIRYQPTKASAAAWRGFMRARIFSVVLIICLSPAADPGIRKLTGSASPRLELKPTGSPTAAGRA
jgi:hypothetical protein